MTPAKLLVLVGKRMDDRALDEKPIAQLTALLYNINRDHGDKEKGRPAEPPKTPDHFAVFKKRGKSTKTLAAKDEGPGGSHTRKGAKADRSAWMSYAIGKTRRAKEK